MSRSVICLVLLCAFEPACSDDDRPSPDVALPDSLTPDAARDGRAADTRADAGAPDTQVAACSSSLSLSPLVLSSSYCVVHRTSLGSLPDALAYSTAGKVWTFKLGAASPFAGKVEEAAINPQTGKLGTATTFYTFTPTGSPAKAFPGEFLARSAKDALAVGYTVSGNFDGAILWGEKGKTPSALTQATGNYDVVFLDDSTLLVNGTGMGSAQEGQGVYLAGTSGTARRLVKDLGIYSGHLALGTSVLFAGGYFSGGNKIYGFTRAEVQTAKSGTQTLSPTTDGDLVLSGGVTDAVAVGDTLVVAKSDTSYKFQAIEAVPVTVSGSSVQAGTTQTVVTAGGNVEVKRLASDGAQIALVLVDASQNAELAVIRRK